MAHRRGDDQDRDRAQLTIQLGLSTRQADAGRITLRPAQLDPPRAARGRYAPLTPPVGWANTANLRRHYERLPNMPDRLLAVGDSACAFNPVYGQGMSVAAKTAVALDEQLARHGRRRQTLDGFTKRMQKVVAKSGDAAWMMATADDLRFPETTGARYTRAMRFQHRYRDRALAAGTVDATVLGALMQAFLLLAPPTVLFRPGIVARALRHGGSPNTQAPMVAVPPHPETAVA